MKKKAIIALIFVILIGTGYLLYLVFNRKNPNYIETYGNIEIRTVDLSFQVKGIIKDIYFEEGDYVKKGDLLAVLDDRDYKANYKKALFEEKSLLAQKNEDVSKYERNKPLCNDDTISKQECTTLLNKKDLSNARYEQSIANREFQKNQLDYTRLYALQEGIITTRIQEIGATVQPNQTVFVMSLNKPIWVRTYINEKDLGNIKYGKKAKILTDTKNPKTGKKKEYEGYVGYISPVAEFTPKTVQTEDLRVDLVYRIRVYIDNTDEYLRQGMPVTVRLKAENE
ncbi:MAG: efflux RND transporter periplasmic adaptor subunit [Candidatus Gastranaerophilales bacterium]|nr:efflux RND transporter periplasmic adaptor subunit [Candidatus Gastranaerophilales bacterium]